MTNISNFKIVKTFNKNTIFCRNFFIFLLLLKYNINGDNINSNFFVKPKTKNVYTIIRSPYRHKLARHQLCIQRYEIHSNISFFLKKEIRFDNFSELSLFFSKFKNLSGWFESNLVYQHKSFMKFLFFFENNFFLKNYK